MKTIPWDYNERKCPQCKDEIIGDIFWLCKIFECWIDKNQCFNTHPYDEKYSLIIPEKVNYLLCDPSQKPSEF